MTAKSGFFPTYILSSLHPTPLCCRICDDVFVKEESPALGDDRPNFHSLICEKRQLIWLLFLLSKSKLWHVWPHHHRRQPDVAVSGRTITGGSLAQPHSAVIGRVVMYQLHSAVLGRVTMYQLHSAVIGRVTMYQPRVQPGHNLYSITKALILSPPLYH